jgi:hypothetical protein
MHSKHPECLGSDRHDRSRAANVRLREEPDEEDDEEEDEGYGKEKEDDEDGDNEDEGYLVCGLLAGAGACQIEDLRGAIRQTEYSGPR